ncbi:tetratricopeptide repeat protein [Mastigocladopsis repens]|uniref:tetratricopeptide repeat protein n=1 Tax=Mastigocladopsis repens TaxID=221287 RepID=UPI0002E9D2FF
MYPMGEQKVVSPPELTNADLEFLFTQLLEGVHQARGQQWALKYLQRMENRISQERWIDWLLDFGERLLTSPAPNDQLAERMVQLGELGIGTIGELSYDIGIRLLTKNLGKPYWETEDKQDTETLTPATLPTLLEEKLTLNKGKQHSNDNRRQQTETTKPASASNSPHQEYTSHLDELIWEYDGPDAQTTAPDPLLTPFEEQEEESWVKQSLEAAASEVHTEHESTDLQPLVTVTLDELLVRLEQSTSLVQDLASGLGVQSEVPVNTNSLTNQPQTTLERAQAWFYQGLNQAKSGDLSGAIASYDKALEIHPNSHEYWFNRGLTLFYLGHFSEAIASYDKAIALKPDFYKCWYNRGGALGEMGHFEEAIFCFDKAIEIKFDDPEAWSSRGVALQKLGRPLEAVASYDKALLLEPQDQDNWYYRGVALALCGQINDAIASFDKALEIQSDYYQAWYNRGLELSHLGRFEDAIASYEQATKIQSDYYQAWYALASALDKIGRHEEAISSYEQAAQISPNSHEVWIDTGVVQANLGRWYDAISSWEKALLIKPDYYLAWFNCAVALENLGRREQAIASYDKAIKINPQFDSAWYNRAVVLFHLERFEEAIASYDNALQIKPDSWEAWIGRGNAAGNAVYRDSHLTFSSPIASTNAALYERGYEGKLASYEQGLKYVSQDAQPEGWGRLHLALGNVHYEKGKRHSTPCYYWQQAIAEYHQALRTLTPEAFPQLHLEVLQNLIKALVGLGQTSQAQEFHQDATDLLQHLLSEITHSHESKKQLALKYAGFEQLAVDIAVQSGEIAQALEIAEYGKNACLTRLLFGWRDKITSPNYPSIHQLLNPTTAIIYWHISPCTLRTFIIKYKSPEPIPIFTPVLNVAISDEIPVPEAVQRLVEFEDWLEDWNQQYSEYRRLQINDTSNKSVHSWQVDMQQRLLNLKNILNISAIVNELDNITHLILIPHRDLHRFPLHALFNISSPWEQELLEQHSFTFTYLPNAQVGLSLKSQPLAHVQNLPLLIVEHPESTNYPTPQSAKLESEAISQMFSHHQRILCSQASKMQVENALSNDYNIFHFTGYVTDNFSQPQKSEFLLAGEDKLTIEEICKKPIASYKLMTLSTCETAMISNQHITTEYVGLASAFLNRGVAHVLSTLWTVESAAIALVMIEFYRRLQQDNSAANALAQATEWLKDLTAGELKKWYEELLSKLPQGGVRIRAILATELYRTRKMPAETKLYNHPYYWAAFKISGKFYF